MSGLVGDLRVVIDSRLRLVQLPGGPRGDFSKALKERFDYPNPEYAKARALNLSTWGKPQRVHTWDQPADGPFPMTLPRGGTKRLRQVARDHGLHVVFEDRRVSLPPVEFPPFMVDRKRPNLLLRDYQQDGVAISCRREQGIVRAPTGSGKTPLALATVAQLGQPALFIMRDTNLLKQWVERVVKHFGVSEREIGRFSGSKQLKVGARFTFALQQTLYSKTFPLDEVADQFGVVAVDEVHTAAARTFQLVVDRFPARYRFGYSADESRKDKMEFLVYDQFGDVIHDVDRGALERAGVIVPVTVRVVPTDFQADWYRNASGDERNFNQLLEEMTVDDERNLLITSIIKRSIELEQPRLAPIFVFTHRREHAREIADDRLLAEAIPCGKMLGGDKDAERFEEDKRLLETNKLDVAVGTFTAIGQGIDVPSVRAGVIATPIGSNEQFFNQVRGRVCRAYPGKREGVLWYIWDRHVFPKQLRNLLAWNGGRVDVMLPDGTYYPADEYRP